LSFYPAAFSGIIPRTYQSSDTTRGVELATVNFQPRQMDLMVCALQISSLDRIKKSEKKEKRTSVERRIAISNSSPLLLQNWHGLLRTTSIEYASDPDFAVSMKYGAYNPLGYSNRVSVIIDKKGKIAYVDTDYSLEDESVLDRKLAELQQRGK
jgi:peroxiredoxin